MTSFLFQEKTLLRTKKCYGYASLVLFLTLLAQIALSYLSESVVVFGDTVHLASDNISQWSTWIVLMLMMRMYIDHSTTVVFTMANIILLVVGGLWVGYESFERFLSPVAVDKFYAFGAGTIGLLGNLCAVSCLKGAQIFPTKILEQNHHVNLVHLRSDVWLSAVVILSVIGSALIGVRVDPALGLLVAMYVVNEGVGHAYHLLSGKHSPFRLHEHKKHTDHHH